MNISANLDINQICRVCLQTDPHLLPLFDEQTTTVDGVSLPEMIQHCTNFMVSQDDAYPQLICNKCIERTHSAYSFKKLYETSHSTLTALLELVSQNTQEDLKPIVFNIAYVKTEEFTPMMNGYSIENPGNESSVKADPLETEVKNEPKDSSVYMDSSADDETEDSSTSFQNKETVGDQEACGSSSLTQAFPSVATRKPSPPLPLPCGHTTGGFKAQEIWTEEQTKWLLDKYNHFKDKIGSGQQFRNKRAMLEHCSILLENEMGIKRTYEQLANRFKTVYRRASRAKNKKTSEPTEIEAGCIEVIRSNSEARARRNERAALSGNRLKKRKFDANRVNKIDHPAKNWKTARSPKIAAIVKTAIEELDKRRAEREEEREKKKEARHKEKVDLVRSLFPGSVLP